MRPQQYLPFLSLALLVACGEPDGDPDPRPEPATVGPYATCPFESRVGAFEMSLREGFTAVQGMVASAVRPSDVPQVTATEGSCTLLQPKTLFCDPPCGGGQTCADDGSCVPLPSNQNVGTVTIEGLSSTVEMEARPPVYFYNHVGDLPHPGFAEGAELHLNATGDERPGFAVATSGVAELVVTSAALAMERDQEGLLEWTAGSSNPAVRVEIELNIANHGGTPARVFCVSEDDGEFGIPVTMINALLDFGYSGFPSVALTRAGSNVVENAGSCVEFRAQSTTVLDVEIPGLTSCSDSGDCPEGQTCQPDLTCG